MWDSAVSSPLVPPEEGPGAPAPDAAVMASLSAPVVTCSGEEGGSSGHERWSGRPEN